jgi:hypothetical protein
MLRLPIHLLIKETLKMSMFASFKALEVLKAWWLMPVILANQEDCTVQGQPRQKVHKTPSQSIAGHGGMCIIQAMWEA